MKILTVSHMFPSDKYPVERSGVFVLNLIDSLKQKGHGVEVISPVADPGKMRFLRKDLTWYQFADHLPNSDTYRDIPVKYPRYISPVIGWKMFFSSIGDSMARGISDSFYESTKRFKPDIIHAHTLMPDTLAVLNLRKKLNIKTPVISTVHGGEVTYPLGIETLRDRPEDFNYPFYNRRMKRIIENTDGIITVSNTLKDLMEYYWDGNYRTIYNGIADEWFRHDQITRNKRNEIITVGALIDRKRICSLAEVFSGISQKYHNWNLRIIGEGKNRKFIENKFSNLIREKRIIMMGNIPNEDVMEYMRRASIFALPSVREPFGVVFIEAMASGLPVIGCNDGGPSEIISHDKDGMLIEPDNTNQLKNYLIKLIENNEMRDGMSEKAYKKAAEKFNWSVISQQTLDYYSSFLD